MSKLDGIDEVLEKEEQEEADSFKENKKKKRMFHYWDVAGTQHKLKLNTAMISALENKYKTNLMNLITSDDIPPLTVMLTIIQGAMSPWEHKIEYKKVQKIYDKWTEEGGNQVDLYSKVLMPTIAVSGFFTESQSEAMIESLMETDALQ